VKHLLLIADLRDRKTQPRWIDATAHDTQQEAHRKLAAAGHGTEEELGRLQSPAAAWIGSSRLYGAVWFPLPPGDDRYRIMPGGHLYALRQRDDGTWRTRHLANLHLAVPTFWSNNRTTPQDITGRQNMKHGDGGVLSSLRFPRTQDAKRRIRPLSAPQLTLLLARLVDYLPPADTKKAAWRTAARHAQSIPGRTPTP
jgi:hypothetical protein